MLLHPAPSIHTAFMRFAFDAIFMDATLRVLKVVECLPPWRVASKRRAWAVLEIAEGEIDRRGIGIGDQLGVVEVTDELGAVNDKAAWRLGNWTSIASDLEPEVSGDGTANSGNASANGGHPVAVGHVGPRVLVVGTDRRFRSVAAALLTRRGCAVSLGDGIQDIGELVNKSDVDVVVLDAGLSLTEAAHLAAKIQALRRPAGIVVVGEQPEHGLTTMPILPKWGSFHALYEAIERAQPQEARRAASASHG
jgi:CheY-like chemotaxis protein